MGYTESETVEKPIINWLQEQGWTYKPPQETDRAFHESFDKPILHNSLRKFNPSVVKTDSDAQTIIGRLANLPNEIKGNKEFFTWLRNEGSISLRQNEHSKDIKLIDYDNPDNNIYTITNQYVFHGRQNIRPDIILLINGIPLILIECKTQSHEETDYTDAVNQIIRYNNEAPQLFKHLAYTIATDGANFRFGWTDPNRYNRWRNGYYDPLEASVKNLLTRERVLDYIQNFIVFETAHGEITKKVAMQQQAEATNKIIQRVLHGEKKNGLIWHTQGSGKTLTMLFTAWKLKRQPELRNPTVFILVDRKQLEKQFRETFTNAEFPHTRWADRIDTLRQLIQHESREVIITTIQKFQDIPHVDTRDNIIILIDEAHRSQYGKLATKRDNTFPNASLYAFTGTPIDKENKKDTFTEFSYPDEEELYLHKYSILQSQEDGSTIPLVYEPRLTKEQLPREILDREFLKIASGLDKDEQEKVLEKSANIRAILKADARIRGLAEDIAEHYKTKIEPNGFKAMIVCVDREACGLIKQELDKHLPPENSQIIFSGSRHKDPKVEELLKSHYLTRSKQLDITRKEFQKKDQKPNILIVCNMLLTGFDAPILKAMYLDKPLRDHNLLQAIARVNRPYPGKNQGLIVDYVGIFYRLQDALNFELEDIEGVAEQLEKLKEDFYEVMDLLRTQFKNQPRENTREALYKIFQFLETKDNTAVFKQNLDTATKLFETISPDKDLYPHLDDYTWFHKINAAYNKHLRRGKDSLKPYQQKTQQLIRDKLVLKEINTTLPTLTIGPEYLRELEKEEFTTEEEVMELRQALSVHIRINLGSLKFYETLSQRLERILRLKDPEQMNLDFRQLVKDINHKEAEMKAKNLSITEYALLISAQDILQVPEKQLISFIKDLMQTLEPKLFPGWNLKTDTHRAVQVTIFESLHERYKDKVEDINQLMRLKDDFVKWIERNWPTR
ncbi:MAG: HsdR family type I site-specific deoxyribonuclease [Candidatus Bathyarchaeota archaeon]|nr:HsdR family type I site-specific deoxyribonuclease [Candidatus Bathyarchaeota archaeon]